MYVYIYIYIYIYIHTYIERDKQIWIVLKLFLLSDVKILRFGSAKVIVIIIEVVYLSERELSCS